MAPSSFDDQTHEQLQAMIAKAAPQKVSSHAQLLMDVSKVIAEVSLFVRNAVDKADWGGESADAYRAWAQHFAQEGNQLSTYAHTVGNTLQQAGQALTDAQASMPKPTTDTTPKGEQHAPITDDPTTREKARQEAIRTLERLDSYYTVTTTDLQAAKEPNFRPPRPPGVPDDITKPEAARDEATSADGTPLGERETLSSRHPVTPQEAAVRTSLDSLAAAPSATDTRPTLGIPGGQTNPPSPTPTGPTPAPAVLGPTGRPTVGRANPVTAPSPRSENNRSQAVSTGQNRTPASRAPVAGIPGSIPAGSTVPGASNSSTSPGRGPQPAAPHSGTHGGQLRPAEPARSIPRGTVISADTSATGRPTAGGGAGGYPPASGNGGAGGNSQVQGRRLAAKPGGVAQPPRPNGAGTRAVVPGNGVVSGSTPTPSSASTPAPKQAARKRSTRQPGRASDRFELSEKQRRRIVPPVIG